MDKKALRDAPYYKNYPDRELAKTAKMSLEERAAYRDLKDHLWLERGTIKADDEGIARLLRISKRKWLTIKPALLDLFEFSAEKVTDSTLTRARLDAELTREKLAENGRAGGRKRMENLEKALSESQANAKQMLEQLPKHTNTTTKEESLITSTSFLSREDENELSTGLSTELSTMLGERMGETETVDFNQPVACITALEIILKRRLQPKEQELAANWCYRFDIRNSVIRIVWDEVQKFEEREGRSPPLNYFKAVLERSAVKVPQTESVLKLSGMQLQRHLKLQKG